MEWIKRNLYFVIASFVGVVLLGAAGWYLYSTYTANNEVLAKLDEQIAALQDLNRQDPHPGEKGKVDNIEAARQQQQHLRDYLRKARTQFERIPPVPDLPKLSDKDFSSALSRTIDQLQKDASSASVSLPPIANGSTCAFSFEAQKQRVAFAAGSLGPLSTQLGEVKAICDVLIQAKVNSLDNIKREPVSEDDHKSSQFQTDYLTRRSITNDLAVISPYEVTFRCFSSELAAVISGLGSSSACLLVATVDVKLAPATGLSDETTSIAGSLPTGVMPTYGPSKVPAAEAEAFSRRYGVSPGAESRRYGVGPGADAARRYGGGEGRYGGPAGGGAGVPYRPVGAQPTGPAYPQPTVVQPTPGVTAPAGTASKGLPTVLDERLLEVRMAIEVVKLVATK